MFAMSTCVPFQRWTISNYFLQMCCVFKGIVWLETIYSNLTCEQVMSSLGSSSPSTPYSKRTLGPVSRKSRNVSNQESQSKISNLMFTELFLYEQNPPSYKKFQVYTPLCFKIQINQLWLRVSKCFRGFIEIGPWPAGWNQPIVSLKLTFPVF